MRVKRKGISFLIFTWQDNWLEVQLKMHPIDQCLYFENWKQAIEIMSATVHCLPFNFEERKSKLWKGFSLCTFTR